MGWDVWVEMDAGGKDPLRHDENLSYTHNCDNMIQAALDVVNEMGVIGENHIYALNKIPCKKADYILTKALDWWDEQPVSFFKKMESENGWGSAEGAYTFWTAVRDLCVRFPKATLRVAG